MLQNYKPIKNVCLILLLLIKVLMLPYTEKLNNIINNNFKNSLLMISLQKNVRS